MILNEEDILQKTKRIAYQIVEYNAEENELVIIGLQPNGYFFAEMLLKEIKKITKDEVSLYSLRLKKHTSQPEGIKHDFELESLTGKVVVIADDVANTGQTLAFACNSILPGSPKKIQVAVLVDRKHKHFPICADYVGLSLATTMKEHVDVEMQKKLGAFLVE